MKKSILLFCSILICIAILISSLTYSKYFETANGNMKTDVGKWNIKINNMDITQKENYNFVIDNIIIEGNDNVLPGKMAPGVSGYFEINIDPSDTDVSILYEITIDMEKLENSQFKLTNIFETTGNVLIQTGKNSYTGIISLEEIKKNKQNTIKIEVDWENNEEYQNDYEFSNSTNNNIKLPISVRVKQYLGETIQPYE